MNDSASQPGSSGRPTHFWREEIGLAMVFLTRLPWPGRLPESRPLMAAAWAFPVVGVGVGLIAAFAYWIAHGLGLPASIAALSAIAAAALATGALHEDEPAFATADADAAMRRRVLDALGPEAVPVDELIRGCQLSAPIVATVLLEAELAGLVDRYPGNLVARRIDPPA